MKISEITVIEAWNGCCSVFAPIKLYWNDELVWDDDVDFSVWVHPTRAFAIFEEKYSNWSHSIVASIKIDIVDYHHSIVKMYGEKA